MKDETIMNESGINYNIRNLQSAIQHLNEHNALLLGIFAYLNECKTYIKVVDKVEFKIVTKNILTMIDQGSLLSEWIMDETEKAQQHLNELKNNERQRNK